MRTIGEASDQKSENIAKLRPEGRPVPIFGAGPAECAEPAEALELCKELGFLFDTSVPWNGGGGFNRLRTFG